VRSSRLVLVAAAVAAFTAQTPARPSAVREDAYRASNVGVALLEQFNYSAAADKFRDALRIDPGLALARVNLAIALLYAPDLDGAEREAAEAARLLPQDAHPPYVAGLAARARGGREEQARRSFERVLQMDSHDVGAQINLGQLDLQQQRYDQAIEHFRAALADEPFSVTAAYNLGLALTRAGRRDEGLKAMERSQAMRSGGYGIIFSANYLEQGR
jgi:tetratricopeptide (TPR) repeat protein